jgi:cytochrome c oxidase subunit 1
MLGVLAVDIHLHDTYFVVAHFHYVMMGGTVIAFLGGIHYWWPKMFGKMYNTFWSTVAAGMVFVGFNATFFPQFILGTQGMPRRYYDYVPEFQTLNIFSTVGSWLLALGLLITLVYLLASLRKNAPKAGGNPWGGATLEWTTTSPPDPHNFAHTPIVHRGPYDYHLIEEFKTRAEQGGDGADQSADTGEIRLEGTTTGPDEGDA